MKANGPAIRALRERSGWSLTDLAREAAIDITHLSRMETGKRAGTPRQLCEIARILQVPVTVVATSGPEPETEQVPA